MDIHIRLNICLKLLNLHGQNPARLPCVPGPRRLANHPGSGAKLHAKAKFACKNGCISAKPLMAVKRLAAGGAKKCQKVPVLQAGSASPVCGKRKSAGQPLMSAAWRGAAQHGAT
ncbi:MAG: hypothetical protein ACTTJV_06605 [Ottowia sp.]